MGRSGRYPRRFEVLLIDLDPTVGSEIRKVRPCIVLSPDSMNRLLNTFLIAPLTSGQQNYPSRVLTNFNGRPSAIALEQLRTVDRRRIVRFMGRMDAPAAQAACRFLQEMFDPAGAD